ncbi:MAG: cache domain-containing protein [Deltaproteobacteria bacterium]|nr:cache domain-containing protein [Deltaproteobacteria bacterium]
MRTRPTRRFSLKLSVLRITIPAALSVLLFAATIFLYILPFIEDRLMDQKRELTRQLAEVALDTLRFYDGQVRSGALPLERGQSLAIQQTRELRYGPEGKDYFWINDLTPAMIMHPYRSGLEGRDISGLMDPNGKRLFEAFVRKAREQGSGYVDYMWQWKDDPSRIVPKVSYVKLFEPWGWIVGTGLYVEDVHTEIARITRGLVVVCSAILGITLFLSAYIIRQGRRIDRERSSAWNALQASEGRFRQINRELESGLSEVFEGLRLISAGDPLVRISETSAVPLISRLKGEVNKTAANISEIVELSHEFAIGLAEHFHVLKLVSEGDLEARVTGSGRVDLLESLKNVTNQMIESVAREVAERRQVEDALRQSEQRFREMARLLPTAICEMGPDFNISYMNDVGLDMLGYSRGDLEKGIDGARIFQGEDLEELMSRAVNSPSSGMTKGLECKLSGKGDVSVVALVHAGRMSGRADSRGIRLSLTDITERKRLEVQLQLSQKMEAVGTLAGGIAHNFNNLLMGIQGYASLMLLSMDANHPHYAKLKGIEKQVRSGSRLTNQLLGYAREGKFEVRPASLNHLVRETSDTLSLTRKDIRIQFDLDPDLSLIRADQGQIEQVLLNLYVNAADAMPEGGVLLLRTRNSSHEEMKGKRYNVAPGNYARLTVTDTGRGMDPRTMERIFEPFFTTKGLSRGTGLGLASVYGIVKAHGGYIDVESAQGEGTRFDLFFPAVVPRKETKSGTDEQIDIPLRGEGETILVVDDEETVLEVASEILRRMDYRVLKARSGKEALSLLRKNPDLIKVVLLDLIMPDMGGGETFDRIREIDPSLKVLLSSGYCLDGQASEILARGCDGFIQKPYLAAELSAKLRALLS